MPQHEAFAKITPLALFPSAGEHLLTTLEAAERLNVPDGTLRQWRGLGVGPAYHKIGRGVRYAVADLEQWVRQSRRVPSVRENTTGMHGTC